MSSSYGLTVAGDVRQVNPRPDDVCEANSRFFKSRAYDLEGSLRLRVSVQAGGFTVKLNSRRACDQDPIPDTNDAAVTDRCLPWCATADELPVYQNETEKEKMGAALGVIIS